MTNEEKNELKAAVLQELQAESQDVGELQPVDTLDGLQSLPALRGKELVSAPVSLLSKPAQDAAAAAETAVKNAINKAEVSTQDAIAKADSAVKDAVGRAEAATQEAKAKTDAAAQKATDAAAKAEGPHPLPSQPQNSPRKLRARQKSPPTRRMLRQSVPRRWRQAITNWPPMQGMASRHGLMVSWIT